MHFSLLNFIGECLFPSFCCNCKELGSYLCSDCYELLEFYLFPISLESLKTSPLYLDHLSSAVVYEPVIGSLLHYLKYNHAREVAYYLADFLYFSTQIPQADIITGVPLHPLRQNERGYNQSELMGQRLAMHCKIPYHNLLKRTKLTAAQASLKYSSERFTNLKNIFEPTAFGKEITGKRILLIDDVCTTGTTLNECARILKENGAATVIGLTVAHGS